MSVGQPSDPILQGYLHKRSKHLKMWKVRYFLLTKDDLVYSKKSGKKTRVCAALHSVNVIDDQNAVTHAGNFVIELRSPLLRVFLSASTEQERMTWVMAMRSLQQDNSHHSTAAAGSSAHLAILQRPASDPTIGAMPRRRSTITKRRKRVSKDRKEERRRRQLPKLKKSFSEAWVEDVLVRNDRDDVPLLEALCFAGIPKELRGRVWAWVLGNKLLINEELFNICKTRAQAVQQEMELKKEADSSGLMQTILESGTTDTSGESAGLKRTTTLESRVARMSSESSTTILGDYNDQEEYQDIDEAKSELAKTMILLDAVDVAEKLVSQGERSIRLVSVDMPRTFGHHALFQTGADGTTRTVEVLEAYSCYRPDLGYVQGMSYLAAALCFHMDSFTAFKAMVALMSNSVLFDMFRMEAKRTFHYINAYGRILEFELPQLHAHFQNSGIDAQMYAVDWALTLFTRSLPLNLAFRLWDCFVLVGTPFFFQASMGILCLFEDRLLAMEPEEIMRFLHHLPKTTTSVELFAAIDSVSLSCREINVILAGGEERPWSPESPRMVEVKFPETYE